MMRNFDVVEAKSQFFTSFLHICYHDAHRTRRADVSVCALLAILMCSLFNNNV